MLRELIECGKNIRIEGYTKWNKSPQGTNSEGKEATVQINDLEHKVEINNQPAQNEKTRIGRKLLTKEFP